MLRKFGLATSLVLAGLGSAAAAEEHYVLMVGKGYFPNYVHPEIGDTIRFVNIGVIPMAATATNDSWTTGLVLPGSEIVLPVTDGMMQTFDNTLAPGDLLASLPDGYVEDPAVIGVVDYLNPPNTTSNAMTGEEHVFVAAD